MGQKKFTYLMAVANEMNSARLKSVDVFAQKNQA